MIRQSFLRYGIVNRVLPSFNGGSNEITLTVPLISSNLKEHSINLIVCLKIIYLGQILVKLNKVYFNYYKKNDQKINLLFSLLT